MLDRDLAELYNVETRRLNEQVKRNRQRFPPHFMFQLNKEEFANLISQNATSSSVNTKPNWGGRRISPLAFTEHGVLQLSNVLKSKRAVRVSIRIIDVFVKMRAMISAHKDILLKVEQLENHVSKHNREIHNIFEVLKRLLNPANKPMKKIGYRRDGED